MSARHERGVSAHVPPEQDPLWYKTAVIYELSVRAFFDSNGDGIGDFRGLTQRLDYLQRLGVNCVWLLPFTPSPMRDGGYDVGDYASIHPDFGTMADFRRFIREAHERGIRVIAELVVNHTSDQHAWFQRARRAPRGSALRNMYVWSDTDTPYADVRIIFSDTEISNWTWDPVAGQYYWHRFFAHQPDLNFDSPRVRRAVQSVMKFWFDAGVDGLRVDAVTYLIEREGTTCDNLPETHAVVREWRAFVEENYPGRLLLAEANLWPADVIAYFGDGDEFQMAFHFPLMPRMFMALRQEDRHPIVDILQETPPIPETCQWGLFLRNHDELTLEMVTDTERDYMYSAYAADRKMRLNGGIRRRLAPLLDNNRRAIELLHSLLFSLPGTPVLYYGDELGMGDNWYLGDRDGVRTPMQWTPDRNAGFSQADAARLYAPPVQDPLYGYQAVSVEAQERSASSLLNWMRRMIALRRRRPVLGLGSMELLHPENRAVFAFIRQHEEQVLLVVANLSRFVQPVALDLGAYAGSTVTEVIGGNTFPPVTEQPYFLSLGPHTFYWFDLTPQHVPVLPEGALAPSPLQVHGDWYELFEGETRARLEAEYLPAFLRAQPWFGGKDRTLEHVRLHELLPLLDGSAPAWAAFFEATYDDGTTEMLSVPLGVASGRAAREVRETTPELVVGPVEGARGHGVLYDPLGNEAVVMRLLALAASRAPAGGRTAALAGAPAEAFEALYDALDDSHAVQLQGGDLNTTVGIGGSLVLKVLRRMEPGLHPELEVAAHLEQAGFEGTPRLAGAISLLQRGVEDTTWAVLHERVWHQADGWTWALGELRRYLEEAHDAASGPAPGEPTEEGRLAEPAYRLGQRTAEMHRALADPEGDEAFVPTAFTPEHIAALQGRIAERLERLAPALEALRDTNPAAEAALTATPRIRSLLLAATPPAGEMARIRIHGDFHLGQLLWIRQDFRIIDFEGEVGLPLAERRRQRSALVDIASMVRSFEYAAAVGLREFLTQQTDPEQARARFEPLARAWAESRVQRFLGGYRATLGEGSTLLPPPEAWERWLALYRLDKALREFEYELGRRPEWAIVPLETVANLLVALAEPLEGQ